MRSTSVGRGIESPPFDFYIFILVLVITCILTYQNNDPVKQNSVLFEFTYRVMFVTEKQRLILNTKFRKLVFVVLMFENESSLVGNNLDC